MIRLHTSSAPFVPFIPLPLLVTASLAIFVEATPSVPQTISKFLIDPQTSQYAARHTFATVFINSEGAKSTELAQMMGRSVTGMDRYIRDLMTIDDVLNAKDKMML